MLSFAGELGLPPQMVSSGVNLSAVAPPPRDAEVAVKQEPVSAPAPSANTHVDVEQLVAQNRALTQRVSMLENLLKQVVAVSNFGGLAPPAPAQAPVVDTLPAPAASVDDTFDITSFIQSNHTTDAPVTPTTYSTTSMQSSQNPTTSFHPVACHSAAVATFVLSSDKGKAQQRARGTGTEQSLDSRLITTERLDKVARILGCLAELRGWTSTTTKAVSGWYSTLASASACRMRRLATRKRRQRPGPRSRRGMRG